MVNADLLFKWPLEFWGSEDEYNVNTKLDFLEDYAIPYNPARRRIYRSLELVSLNDCRVAMFGQDPYPNPEHATGVAFESGQGIPYSLRTMFTELQQDLGLPWPTYGSLRRWTDQGVLLWNVTPTTEIDREGLSWKSYTHKFWPEWQELTKQIVQKLSDKGEIVFVFFGKRAQEYVRFVNVNNGLPCSSGLHINEVCSGLIYTEAERIHDIPFKDVNTVLCCSHPSPLAQMGSKNPIIGSRLFSTINSKLIEHGREPIDWRLT